MAQTIPANQVTLRELKNSFGLQQAQDISFFMEWSEVHPPLSDLEEQFLDRVRANFLELLEDPPMLENSVKMVVLAPLLDLSGFYHQPFRIETETGVDIETEDEGLVIRGRIDVLVIKDLLWLLVIEAKCSDFAVTRAIPQALSYMLGNESSPKTTFGMIVNGNDFLFLKATRELMTEGENEIVTQYANSRLLSLVNPENELYLVLQVLKRLGRELK